MIPESHSNNEDDALAGHAAERSPERSRAAGEGLLSSRPPSIPISYGGEDYLTLSLYLRHARFAELVKLLEGKQRAAIERRKGEDELLLAGQRFLMLPMGGKVSQKRRIHFQWQLQSEFGFVLLLMKREAHTGTLPNGKLEASSLTLMRLGLNGVVERAFSALTALGVSIVSDKVSRVDVCCDLPGVDIGPMCAAFSAHHYVSRAVSCDQHAVDGYIVDADSSVYWLRNEPTSFNLGRSDVRVRVYEKVKECGPNLEKLQTLVERRWGVFPSRAVRAEFQLRRGKLREHGVDGLTDWIVQRASIVRYLTHKWFRLTDGPVDRKHQDRTPILPEWVLFQQGFEAWAGERSLVEPVPIDPQPMPADHYSRSAVGMFISLFARGGVDVDSNDTFIHETLHRLLDQIEGRDMAAEVRRRVLELGVTQPKPQHDEGGQSAC